MTCILTILLVALLSGMLGAVGGFLYHQQVIMPYVIRKAHKSGWIEPGPEAIRAAERKLYGGQAEEGH